MSIIHLQNLSHIILQTELVAIINRTESEDKWSRTMKYN